jgi:hypothetical protein
MAARKSATEPAARKAQPAKAVKATSRKATSVKTAPAKKQAPVATNGTSGRAFAFVLLEHTGDTTGVVSVHLANDTARAAGKQYADALPPVLTPGVPAVKPKWTKAETNRWTFDITSGTQLEIQRRKLQE